MKTLCSSLKDTLKVGRFIIPYRIYENNGPQIICINGVQQSMAMWQSFISRFSSKYRIVLFDFPGQGKAEILSGLPHVTLDEQVQILLAVLEKTNMNENAIMCTASWGGVVAVAFAAKYPDRIKKMVLASLGTKPNKKMVETIMKGHALETHDRDTMAQVLIKAFGENLPLDFKQKIVNQFRKMKEENLRAFCEHGLFVISSKKLSDMVDLKKIKARTILLSGEKDTIIDLDDVKFLATQIPDCEIRIIKGVGHFMHIENASVLDIYEIILQGMAK
ncbi:MAG: alpha/beta hydrolase [Candidatus Omnitrophica bacterium]|nr:alpha/beta hydrolase [Candidatus Omnitrophota bacterium]